MAATPGALTPNSPYELGLALTQEEAQQSLRLIQDNSLTPPHVQLFYAQTWDRSRLQFIYLLFFK
jgi:hypothetical protein